jgi:hypothetical protein
VHKGDKVEGRALVSDAAFTGWEEIQDIYVIWEIPSSVWGNGVYCTWGERSVSSLRVMHMQSCRYTYIIMRLLNYMCVYLG